MGRGKKLTTPVKKLIVKSIQEGNSQRVTARIYRVSKNAVFNLMEHFNRDKTIDNKKSPGRPKKTTEREDRKLINMSKNNPSKSAVDLNREMEDCHGVKVSVSITKRRLRHATLFGRRPAKKPLISLKNCKARKISATNHKDWTPQKWSKVLFSDESKFMMFGSDGIKYVRQPVNARYDPKYQKPTVKHGGGNIIVLGCFSRDGIGPIHRVDGIMDQKMYMDIMKTVMLPHAKNKMGRG